MDSLLKINYINNSKFRELSKDEKDRFIYKHNIIHERLPFIRNVSFSINNIINNGLINLIHENREDFINQMYMDFVENLIISVGGTKYRYRKLSYKRSFMFNNENDYYRTFLLFIDYINSLIPNYSLVNLMNLMNDKNYDFEKNQEFIKLFMYYRPMVEYYQKSDSYYTNLIKHVLAYFLTSNELINNKELFSDIIGKLYDDKSLLDYYRMNYNDKDREVPKDLIKRYNKESILIR